MSIVRDDITLGLGAIGTVLGILNWWKSWDRDRVKLKVIPKVSQLFKSQGQVVKALSSTTQAYDGGLLCIEVINLSSFAITIRDVGFTTKGGRGKLSLTSPIIYDQKGFPRKLEPRESVSFYANEQPFDKIDLNCIAKVYAMTECHSMKTGTSKALKQYLLNSRLESERGDGANP